MSGSLMRIINFRVRTFARQIYHGIIFYILFISQDSKLKMLQRLIELRGFIEELAMANKEFLLNDAQWSIGWRRCIKS